MLAATFFLGAIVLGVAHWLGSNVTPQELDFDISKLTYDDNIVGHWRRVPFDRHDNADGFRQIAASGRMMTCYGDVIHTGTYKIEGTTINTTFEYQGEKNRWTYGFMAGKLIMVHQSYGWIEAYERVPAGILHPSLLP